LSALAYAADISGTDIGTLEKGLKGLTKVMDDASMGIGEGMEAFKLLDIAVMDSEGKLRSTVDVLKEAATKISAIEDPTKQAALAMDLFGARAGPQLLPLLKAGEEGIEELMNKAKELGIVVSTEAAVFNTIAVKAPVTAAPATVAILPIFPIFSEKLVTFLPDLSNSPFNFEPSPKILTHISA
ncbi:unnamed protein product, partial [marine sediment metagenome]